MTNGRHHLLRWPRERVVFIQLRMGYVSVNSWGGGRAYPREIIPTLRLQLHSGEIREFSVLPHGFSVKSIVASLASQKKKAILTISKAFTFIILIKI